MSRNCAHHRKTAIHLLLILIVVCFCNYTALDTGGSSGTEISKVSGSVVDENGTVVPDALVRLRPADFLADSAADMTYTARHSILDTTTASDGSFLFSDIEFDNYVIEISVDDSLGASVELNIEANHPETTLSPLTIAPMAELSGNAQVYYSRETTVSIQVYGIERSATTDSTGNFKIRVPYGKHHLHISAYTGTVSHLEEFDGVDVALQVTPGEERNAGSFSLREPPPDPCTDGHCDSAVVRSILDRNSWTDLPLDSVTVTENGRIVELTLRGFSLSDNLPFELNCLSALRLLDLGETGLTAMFPAIGRMTELEIVRMDQNFIREFSRSIGDCKTLRELDIHGNQLEWLPTSIMDCTALELLDVSDNRLCFVDSATAVWLDQNDPGWNSSQRCR
ncbi:MAG: hypothetical protein JW863_20270 [Chitinispirillaceae bacterium]|nr:hypothetical protein [Chitinispirillaceae bacterium]